MRVPVRGIVLAVLLAACTTPPPVTVPTPTPTRTPDTLSVTALLDLTGPMEPVGVAQRNAMQLWLDQAQQRAPSAVRIRVKFVDVAGSATRLVIELRRAVVDDRADAVVVGSSAQPDDAFAGAVALAAVPVLLTVPAADVTGTAGGWLFGLAPTPADIATVLVSDMIERRVAAPAAVLIDGSRPALVERSALLTALAEQARPLPEVVDVSGPRAVERAKLAAANGRSLTVLGPAHTYADELREIRADTARTLYLSYLTEATDLAEARGTGMTIRWPGLRALVETPPSPRPLRTAFLQGYTDRHGPPSATAATAYDALGLIGAAAERDPRQLDPARLRQSLETRTFAGVVTEYAFAPTRRSPFDRRGLAMLAPDARGLPGLAPSPSPSPSASPSATPMASPAGTGR